MTDQETRNNQKRRTNLEIRESVIATLRERRMNLYELSKKTKINLNTVKRHCNYLQAIGTIGKTRVLSDGVWREVYEVR